MTEEKPKSNKKATDSRFAPAEFKRQIWQVIPETGTTVDDLLDPSYWVHVAQKLKPGDFIEAQSEDGAYFAQLYVVNAGRLWAKVIQLFSVDLNISEADLDEEPEYKVLWKGPHHKWVVLKNGDPEPLHKGAQSEADARLWLKDHLKALSA